MHHAEMGTPRHEASPQKQVRLPVSADDPTFAETGTPPLGHPCAKPLANKLFCPQKQVRHEAPAAAGTTHLIRDRGLSAMKVVIRQRPSPTATQRALLGRFAESGTLEIS
uniref:Uncharacterized protein n=1 Tax=Ralstonia syzygii R24 TaxID=907261 RepID=G3ACM8_9RALS|nr:hypothetical protein RALSY_mp30651 [Ralstonia syzygii R24]